MKDSNRILIGLAKYMIEYHAPICEEQWCWCRASTFNDTIARLKEVDKSYRQIVNEIWDRDNGVQRQRHEKPKILPRKRS